MIGSGYFGQNEAGDKTTMSAFGGSRQQLEHILTKALRSRGNLLTLARCARQLDLRSVERQAREAITEGSVVTDIDRGRALWHLLRQAINRLRPTDPALESTPTWRLYAIAEGFYIQGKPVKEITAELGISSRTFDRERRAAVEAVVTIVWQIERAEVSMNVT